jgi:hypothetical protein
MAISQAMCTSFKVELLSGGHNFNTTNVARTVDTQQTYLKSRCLHQQQH